jgi:hypothetical protein
MKNHCKSFFLDDGLKLVSDAAFVVKYFSSVATFNEDVEVLSD